MANFFEETEINPRTYFTAASRYSDATICYYTDLKKFTLATYKRGVTGVTPNDKFMVIGKGQANYYALSEIRGGVRGQVACLFRTKCDVAAHSVGTAGRVNVAMFVPS